MDTVDSARPAAGERGEIALQLAGVSMGLRPDYTAIQAIEATLGRGLIDVARDALSGKLSLADTAQVACECIRAFGREADDQGLANANPVRIGKLILDSDGGYHAALQTVAGMLSLAVTGGYDSEGNIRPATMTMTTSEAPVAG